MEETDCGYSCLAQNPVEREKFCSSSQLIDDSDSGIMLWEVNPERWADGGADFSKKVQTNKRQKTEVAQISPTATMRCQNGV